MGIPNPRHGPSAELRQFLDPLDPGDYFDCGRARLHGLDDVLIEEARQRGREAGDDTFVLAATDRGLIFCRPSIAFALVAGWDEVTMTRPRAGDPAVLPVRWPGQGELRFTVSRRLAHNIFRRWLQLRMQASRQARHAVSDLRAGRFTTGQVDVVAAGPSTIDRARDLDAEVTGEPAGSVPAVSAATEGLFAAAEPGPVDTDDHLDDGALDRVVVPRESARHRSVAPLVVGVTSTLVVFATMVTLVAGGITVYRRVSGDPAGQLPLATGDEVAAVDAVGPTTIDPLRSVQDDTSPVSGSEGSLPVEGPSNQQLLSLTPDDETAWSPSPDTATGGRSAVASAIASTSSGVPQCSSDYTGCVPDVGDLDGGDVDCLGAGDGPLFIEDEVTVVGTDVFGLDTDGDGAACEADQPPPPEG